MQGLHVTPQLAPEARARATYTAQAHLQLRKPQYVSCHVVMESGPQRSRCGALAFKL